MNIEEQLDVDLDPERVLQDGISGARTFINRNPTSPLARSFLAFVDPALPEIEKYRRYFVWLFQRYSKTLDIILLNKAIAVGQYMILWPTQDTRDERECLPSNPLGSHVHPDVQRIIDFNTSSMSTNDLFAAHLAMLSSALLCRYQHPSGPGGNPIDLDVAIVLQETSIDCYDKHTAVFYATSCNTLLSLLVKKFLLQPTNYRYITDAVSAGRKAVRVLQAILAENQTEPGMTEKTLPSFLSNLSSAYQRRYTFFGNPKDAHESLMVMREAEKAARAAGLSNTETAVYANNLGACLRDKASRDVNPQEAIDESVKYFEAAVEATDAESRDWFVRMFNLGVSLGERFHMLGLEDDHERAVNLLSNLLDLQEGPLQDHRNYKVYETIAVIRFFRYQKLKERADLEFAIENAQRASALVSRLDEGSNTGIGDAILAIALWHRSEITGDIRDLSAAVQLMDSISSSTNSSPTASVPFILRFTNSCLAARICYKTERFDDALNHFRLSLDILPRMFLLGRDYRLDVIEGGGAADLGVDGAACSIACGKLDYAVEMVEYGRSLGWRRNLQMRSAFEELQNDHPKYAQKLLDISRLMEGVNTADWVEYENAEPVFSNPSVSTISHDSNVNTNVPSWEHNFSYTHQWEQCIAEIRQLSGYDNFLRPIQYCDLQKVACNGPVVVINISGYRCDALIIRPTEPSVLVPLPTGTWTKIKKWSDDLLGNSKLFYRKTFSWERQILRPIVDGLSKEIIHPIMTEVSKLFPHAQRVWWCPTGRLTFLPLHLITESAEGRSFIPSYTTSLSSLLRAQSTQSDKAHDVSLLAVTCATAAGQTALPGTSEELQALQEVSQKIRLNTLTNEQATVDQVLSHLSNHSWVHLACHGKQDIEKPYRSCFFLHDGAMHVSQIVAQKLPHAQFAFLAACDTAKGVPELYDESMHLAAGLQFAGFRSVVATNWPVADSYMPLVISAFYGYLFNDLGRMPTVEDTAEALFVAVKKLREQQVPLVVLAPFMHFGI